ncbi:MAG: hypothetical protein QCI82_04500 [Candidatus Thermoplasmatota archaeon]|nr:hypothetical protein [Candidatus Thermoplasmatota archaeon]
MRKAMGKSGAMEGIPLQLIIVVVIGVAALGILVGWLALSGDPDPTMKRVSVDPETVSVQGDGRLTEEVTFTVFIYDNKGDEINGVVVTFSGAVDQKVTQVVDSGGTVQVTVALPSGEQTGTITVKAEKGGGMGSRETTVIVMRG